MSIQVAVGKKANDITITGHNIAKDNLPKESLNQYTLSYQIAASDATNPTEIVIQRKSTKADMNTAALGDILIKSNVKPTFRTGYPTIIIFCLIFTKYHKVYLCND